MILGFVWQFYKTHTYWLVVVIVLSGFGLLFYQSYAEKEVKTGNKATETSENIKQIVIELNNKHQQELQRYQLDLQARDEQNKALTQAVTALSTGKDIDASPSELHAALAALAHGDTAKAKTLFAKTAEKAEQQAK